jgi:hypothetical protein
MKKTLAAIAALALVATSAQATWIRYNATNVFGVADTNWVSVRAIGAPINADGSFIVRGAPFRFFPDAVTGTYVVNVMQGNYMMTNATLGRAIVFAVPTDATTNQYLVGDLAISGYNTYNYSPGVRSISPGGGVGLSATTGDIVITLTNPPPYDLSAASNLLGAGIQIGTINSNRMDAATLLMFTSQNLVGGTNLPGSGIQSGTINSNRMDAATLALFANTYNLDTSTNLPGSGIQSGTINSNRMDAATLALFANTYNLSGSTNLPGSGIQSGSINSNRMDAATLELFASQNDPNVLTNNYTDPVTFVDQVTAGSFAASGTVQSDSGFIGSQLTSLTENLVLRPTGGANTEIRLYNTGDKIVFTGSLYGNAVGMTNYPNTTTNAQIVTPTIRDSQYGTTFTADNNGTYAQTFLKVNGLNTFGGFYNSPTEGSKVKIYDPADGVASLIVTNHKVVAVYGFIGDGGGLTNVAGSSGTDARFTSTEGTITAASNTLAATTIAATTVTATTLSGSGSGLTALNASQISSGTIPLARNDSAVVTNGDTRATTLLNITRIVGKGSELTNSHGLAIFPSGAGSSGQFLMQSADGISTEWAAASGGGGGLLAVNNLAELTDKPTARYNIGADNASNLTNGTLPFSRLTSIPLSLVTNAGTAAYSNATAFDLSGAALTATNQLNTVLRAYTDAATNSLSGVLRTYTDNATNQLRTTLINSLAGSIKTNGASLATAFTNIDFVAGANTSVTGLVSGANVTIGYSVPNSTTVSNGLVLRNGTVTNLLISAIRNTPTSGNTNGLAGMILNTTTDGGVFWDYPTQIWRDTNNAGGFSLTNLNNLQATGRISFATAYLTNVVLTAGFNAWLATNLNGANIKYGTNSGAGVRPDFSIPYMALQTNANFAFLTPTNVNTYFTNDETCVIHITNSAASTITFTAPANIHVKGDLYVTNGGMTTVTFHHYGGKWTNAVSFPIW